MVIMVVPGPELDQPPSLAETVTANVATRARDFVRRNIMLLYSRLSTRRVKATSQIWVGVTKVVPGGRGGSGP